LERKIAQQARPIIDHVTLAYVFPRMHHHGYYFFGKANITHDFDYVLHSLFRSLFLMYLFLLGNWVNNGIFVCTVRRTKLAKFKDSLCVWFDESILARIIAVQLDECVYDSSKADK
jgi:hypothetical protein